MKCETKVPPFAHKRKARSRNFTAQYKGASLIRNSPLLGPYSRTVSRA